MAEATGSKESIFAKGISAMPKILNLREGASCGETRFETPPEILYEQLEILNTLDEAVCQLSTYLEHIEHCEPADPTDIDKASDGLLAITVSLAEQHDIDIASVYSQRLAGIEAKRGPFIVALDDEGMADKKPIGAEVVSMAQTWRGLQIGQFLHDRECHFNIINSPEHRQLRHYVYHIAKLPAYLSEAILEENMPSFVASGRFADCLAFGVKLAILRKRLLPETPLPNR